jgi:nucleoid-associated protein YgaU
MTTSFGANVSSNVGGAAAGVSAAGSAPSAGTVVAAGAAVVGAAVGLISTVASLIPATLRCLDFDHPTSIGLVPFDFNPSKITVTRSTTPEYKTAQGPGAGAPTGSGGAMVWKAPPPEVAINEIVFEGLTCKLRCDTLLNWMSPPGDDIKAAAAAAMGRPFNSEPPTLTFQWGPPLVGFMYDVKLLSTTISYERFNPTGIPVRAKVNLKMKQIVSNWANLPTNPTSGGVPGRRTHVVREGDTLAAVANTYFGNPAIWRRIADVNRINDPTRLRPGTTLFLPSGDDLEPLAR